jgi:GT2 family glycosyltransferase
MNNTFVIVTWNNQEQIISLIKSIEKYEPRSKIIIVDNNSSDKTRNLILECKSPLIQLISLKENVGFAKANNIGIRAVKSKYVTFINPDTILTNPLISYLEENFHNDTGMIGIKILNQDSSLQPSIFKFQRPLSIIVEQFNIGKILPEKLKIGMSPENSRHDERMVVDWLIGAFLFTSLEKFKEVGGFSEDYFLYAEDMDLCYKYHLKHYKVIFDPSKQVIHIGGTSEQQTSSAKSIKLLNSFCIFARKFHLKENIRTLYWSYLIKEKIFKHIDAERSSKYKKNVTFLKENLK